MIQTYKKNTKLIKDIHLISLIRGYFERLEMRDKRLEINGETLKKKEEGENPVLSSTFGTPSPFWDFFSFLSSSFLYFENHGNPR